MRVYHLSQQSFPPFLGDTRRGGGCPQNARAACIIKSNKHNSILNQQNGKGTQQNGYLRIIFIIHVVTFILLLF